MEDDLKIGDVLRITNISLCGSGWNKEFVVDYSNLDAVWFKVTDWGDQICCTQNLALAIDVYNKILPKEYDDKYKIGKYE
jgi:hypothetical protein